MKNNPVPFEDDMPEEYHDWLNDNAEKEFVKLCFSKPDDGFVMHQ